MLDMSKFADQETRDNVIVINERKFYLSDTETTYIMSIILNNTPITGVRTPAAEASYSHIPSDTSSSHSRSRSSSASKKSQSKPKTYKAPTEFTIPWDKIVKVDGGYALTLSSRVPKDAYNPLVDELKLQEVKWTKVGEISGFLFKHKKDAESYTKTRTVITVAEREAERSKWAQAKSESEVNS